MELTIIIILLNFAQLECHFKLISSGNMFSNFIINLEVGAYNGPHFHYLII